MASSGTIIFSEEIARECVRALAVGLSDEARVRILIESLPLEIRREAFKELLYETGLVTPEEGGVLVKWTAQGFARTATKENCPHLKLGHKQPELYRLKDVDEMLVRMRVWPKGRPSSIAPTVFPAAGKAA